MGLAQTTAEKKSDPKRVITEKVVLSYPHLFQPHAFDAKQEPKYTARFLIAKTDRVTLGRIKSALDAAKEEGLSVWGVKKAPGNLKMPIRDGDVEFPDSPEYVGHYFVNANCKQPPGVVDRQVQPILDQTEIYPGCIVRASITLYPYNFEGVKGIACGLNHVQKIADGEPLGNRISVEATFQAIDDDDDDDDEIDNLFL